MSTPYPCQRGQAKWADHHLHSARADLLRRSGRMSEAATAYEAALARVGNDVERRYLQARLAEVSGP